MRFALDEAQQTLRDSTRRFVQDHCDKGLVRTAMATETGFDKTQWQHICTELGWPALIVPEHLDGYAMGYVGLVALQEELGRGLLGTPFLSTVCLGINALLTGASDSQQRGLLPPLVTGEQTATVAWSEAGSGKAADDIACIARRDGDDYILSGTKRFVLDGHTADLIFVAARQPDTSGVDGINLFAVEAAAQGVERTWRPTLDMTRKQAEITLTDVRLPSAARLGEEGLGWPALSRTLDLARVALAAEQVGGAEACLDMAVLYAKTREQFGRPIGSFQAIKHTCADMLVRVESARSASYYAGWVAENEDQQLPEAAAMAKAYCSDAYFQNAADNIQVHGGIGFTWEHDAHLYFKRAQSSAMLLGTADYHREQVAQEMGL